MLDDVFIFDNSDRMSLFYDEPMNVKNELIQTVKLFDGFFLGNVHAGRVDAALCRILNLSITIKLVLSSTVIPSISLFRSHNQLKS